MKFHKFFFENYPADTPYDADNPRYVLSLCGVDAVLQIVMENPYALTAGDLAEKELVGALLRVDVLQEKNGYLAVAAPFFMAKDAAVLQELSRKAACGIADVLTEHKETLLRIISELDNGYSAERNLYHVLSGYVFDGLLFDWLEQQRLVTTSRVHRSGLDYLVILYEDCEALNRYSNRLLCSYNRFTAEGKGFVSFGDSDGERRDFYRYVRLRDAGRLPQEACRYLEYPAKTLIESFERLISGERIDTGHMEAFEYFGYCINGEIAVPVYDEKARKVAEQLCSFVLAVAKGALEEALSAIEGERRLAAAAHGVPAKDLANEVYHLIFGEVNERLVWAGIVAAPPCRHGEGRYFPCFEH